MVAAATLGWERAARTARPPVERGTMPRVRRLLKWVVVTIGIAALIRWLRGRREQAAITAASDTAADPADELRRKLAESRAGEEPEAASEPPAESVEERRAEVYEQGHASLSEMTPDEG